MCTLHLCDDIHILLLILVIAMQFVLPDERMDIGSENGKQRLKMRYGRKVRRRRSRWDIIFEILYGLNEGGSMRKTHIMHYANIDWRNFQKYFSMLVEQGYIKEHENSSEYVITEKGKSLLQRLEELKNELS
ncbi:MAG: winged helix-turn-helix domain-containing protein [Canidatus Methanoxibalbensis ujae]|nr:winged helix-turn-helix domain-containing protein [Candidatus Methanoxibalbensis ujae]